MRAQHTSPPPLSLPILALSLLATAVWSGCGPAPTEDGTNNVSDSLFNGRAGACGELLVEAEEAGDPRAREEALRRYEACVEGEAGMGEGEGDACLSILAATTELPAGADRELLRRLHHAYVDCVFDQAAGEPAGCGDQPAPERCEWLLEEAHRICRDDTCFAEHERAFHACVTGHEPPPREGDGMGDPEACLESYLRRCDEILNSGDEAGFDVCVRQAHELCFGIPTEEDPFARCEPLLREAEERCGDEPRCFEEARLRFEACVNEGMGDPPPPPPCDHILLEARERCGDDPMCHEEAHRRFEACLEGGAPPRGEACLERLLSECEGLLHEADRAESPERGEELRRAFAACVEHAHAACSDGDPAGDEGDPCAPILEEARACETPECRERAEQAWQACRG